MSTSILGLRHRGREAVAEVPDTPEVWDLRLPKRSSILLIMTCNVLLQISFFLVVSSSNLYAAHLGGDATFSGLVLGIPTAFACLALLPAIKYDGGTYARPLHLTCGFAILGHVLYGIAYRANWLYLVLIGRAVIGFSFIGYMYTKRFCTDPVFVGARRRTTLATYLILGQGIGMSAGPFLGGLLYKVGFSNSVFNGFTAPAWLMVVVWAIFWGCLTMWFEDPTTGPAPHRIDLPASSTRDRGDLQMVTVTVNAGSTPMRTPVQPDKPMSLSEWGVSFTICWLAMTCFFIIGAMEASLPIYGAPGVGPFYWSPFAAGNFIALGGIAAFPFLSFNIYLAPRTQDRKTLAVGSGLGTTGLVIFEVLLASERSNEKAISYGSLLVCYWAIALGFNLSSTVCVSLLSKQLPCERNRWAGLVVQLSMWIGRATGTVLGGSSVKMGMMNFVGVQIAIVGVGVLCFLGLWRDLRTKKG